jgi:cyclopropane-fatty-acyl-phospholipid synthase
MTRGRLASIQRYIFPASTCCSRQDLETPGERIGIPIIRERAFGQDFAKTLAIQRSNFRRGYEDIF